MEIDIANERVGIYSVGMYICIYVYTYYVSVCACACLCVSMYVCHCVSMCIYVCICVYLHVQYGKADLFLVSCLLGNVCIPVLLMESNDMRNF